MASFGPQVINPGIFVGDDSFTRHKMEEEQQKEKSIDNRTRLHLEFE